jgi:threonine dehydrogenase-like Zn-dependent dehydrogenase
MALLALQHWLHQALAAGRLVGLMAAYSAVLKGASRVMVVDRHPDRLGLASRIGAIPIDDSASSPIDQVLELTGGRGRTAAVNASATRRTTRPATSTRTRL